ncbi:MAG: Rne/Rng family ribonuclease [Thermodesulfobacteriota bacterium]|nr:Rne/Rng family ribonuclease [Thermodesulfobacteriota bacterium]
MTDESKKPAKKKQAKKTVRKVTTGAWWKSGDELKAKEEDAAPSLEKKKKKAAAGSAKKESQTDKKAAAAKSRKQQSQSSRSGRGKKAADPDRKAGRQKKTAKKNEKKEAGKEKAGQEQKQPGRRGKKEAQERKKKQEPDKKESRSKKVVTKLLINAEEPEECRIAQVENGRLESFHVNTVVRERTKNNIYKGRIVSVEASLQAAFVEIGTGRNGFLPFSDIHPEYFKQDVSEQSRKLISQHQWKKLKIEDVVKRGQEVLVQVVKEVTGNKGANMTTFLSLPGRCLVLMPGSDSAGISRKISGEERRGQLREIMSTFTMPEGIGYIVRTASAEITKTALQQDLRYLLGLWKDIKKRGQTAEVPALIYEEQDTVVRFLRDHFVADIQEITVDTQESFDQVTKFVGLLPSRQQKVQVRLHRGAKPLFNQNNIEEQIESIYQPQVQLPSGGSIVIDPTEALVAIDVNSGRTSQKGDFEKSIFLANMEAADELARQLRLRDLGGLIVVDFIDMRVKKHIRDVEKQVKGAMKRDKAKVDISRISRFGLMQISRQKMGAPIEKGSYRRCEYCEGRGVVRSVETLALYYLRRIQTGVSRKQIKRVEARLPLDVGQYLLNKKRIELAELESRHRASIDIIPRPDMKPNENKIDFLTLPLVNDKEQA